MGTPKTGPGFQGGPLKANPPKMPRLMGTPEPRPTHRWNDPDGDGHNCADCPEVSMWKCDRLAHMHNAYDLLTDEQLRDLDASLEKDAEVRREGTASAGRIPL